MKWLQVLALSVSLPSFMIGLFYGLQMLISENILSEQSAILIFFLLILSVLGLIIYYAKQNSSP